MLFSFLILTAFVCSLSATNGALAPQATDLDSSSEARAVPATLSLRTNALGGTVGATPGPGVTSITALGGQDQNEVLRIKVDPVRRSQGQTSSLHLEAVPPGPIAEPSPPTAIATIAELSPLRRPRSVTTSHSHRNSTSAGAPTPTGTLKGSTSKPGSGAPPPTDGPDLGVSANTLSTLPLAGKVIIPLILGLLIIGAVALYVHSVGPDPEIASANASVTEVTPLSGGAPSPNIHDWGSHVFRGPNTSHNTYPPPERPNNQDPPGGVFLSPSVHHSGYRALPNTSHSTYPSQAPPSGQRPSGGVFVSPNVNTRGGHRLPNTPHNTYLPPEDPGDQQPFGGVSISSNAHDWGDRRAPNASQSTYQSLAHPGNRKHFDGISESPEQRDYDTTAPIPMPRHAQAINSGPGWQFARKPVPGKTATAEPILPGSLNVRDSIAQ